eukprot:759455-Hanusia_phi.AAC.1
MDRTVSPLLLHRVLRPCRHATTCNGGHGGALNTTARRNGNSQHGGSRSAHSPWQNRDMFQKMLDTMMFTMDGEGCWTAPWQEG